MRLRAILGFTTSNNKVVIYRLADIGNNEIRDVPIDKITKAINNNAVQIENLYVKDGEIREIIEVPKIAKKNKNSLSLYDWCQQNGERGQRILEEFNTGGNFPITAKDISYSSHMKPKFRCAKCNNISNQYVYNKTGKVNSKCNFCYKENVDVSLFEWCIQEKTGYGKVLLQEYLNGNNEIMPDRIAYASHKEAYFKCSNCGEINLQKIHHRTRNKRKGCIKCDRRKTSFSEQLLFRWLLSQGIEVINQKYFESEAGWKYFDIYIPALNLVIEHQSSTHESEERQFNDELAEIIAQQLGINYLEVCELDSKYYREETNWCITYELQNKQQMINKLQAWFFKNYNLHLSNIITPEVGRSAWQVKFPIQYHESLLYNYPRVAVQIIPELNFGITPDLIPCNSTYKFWLRGPEDKKCKFMSISNRTAKYKK